MSYVKIFDSIVASTIWGEPSDTRVVWVTMLAIADRDGYVKGSVPGLAHLCRVSRESCEKALESFLSPDPDSRTKTHEGRRIAEVPGGWLVLNYETYRDMATKEEKQEKDRLRQQRKRERDAASRFVTDVTVGHAPSQEVASHLISSHLTSEVQSNPRSARSVSAEEKAAKEARARQLDEWFDDFWNAYDHRKGKKAAYKAFCKVANHDEMVPHIIAAAAAYRAFNLANDTKPQFIKHPATWLNGECWIDVLDEPAKPTRPFAKPIPHIQNLALGTPSCNCPECIAYRLKRTNQA